MPKTLLLADDSVTIQKVVGLSFANEDVELVTVDNGDDAVERARALHPDLILADVVMPGLSGYEVCETIRADVNLAQIPVLLLSGTFEPFDDERATQVGATGHIVKPFEAQALVSRVNELLNQSLPEPDESTSTEPQIEIPTEAEVPPAPEPGELTQAFDAAFIADDPLAAPELALDDDSLINSMDSDNSEFAMDDKSTYVLDVSDEATSGFPEGIIPIAEDVTESTSSNLLDETVAFSPDSGTSFSSEEPYVVTNLDEPDFEVPADAPADFSSADEVTGPDEISPIEDFGQAEAAQVAELVQEEIVLDQEFSEINFAEEESAFTRTEELEEIQAVEFSTTDEEPFEIAESLIDEDTEENRESPEINIPEVEAGPQVEALEEVPLLEADALVSEEPVEDRPPTTMPSTEAQQHVHDALEKIAWEAFGDVTERLVQETVKRVEQVAWEVIPQLAESLIKEEIQKLKEESTGK